MPELPEVEVVRQSLNKRIKEKKVKKVLIRNRNLRQKIPLNFASFLENRKIIKVERFSKYLIINLSNKKFCLFHLGMSGTIHLVKNDKIKGKTNTSFYSYPLLPKKHNHIEIIFKNLRMVYNDPRRFGYVQIFDNAQLLKKKFAHLGPEPFDKKFNLNYIISVFKKKSKNIKNFLIDQNFVSGIGNIYASEILFLSKINPSKKVFLFKKKDCSKIIKYSRKVLLTAIERGGSSIRDFKDTTGKVGSFQKNFKVYDREGLNCKRRECQGIIKKKIISKRSSFFCDTCQK